MQQLIVEESWFKSFCLNGIDLEGQTFIQIEMPRGELKLTYKISIDHQVNINIWNT